MLSSFVFLAACVLLFSSLLWSETCCLLGLLCWMCFALFSFVFPMNLLIGAQKNNEKGMHLSDKIGLRLLMGDVQPPELLHREQCMTAGPISLIFIPQQPLIVGQSKARVAAEQ